MQPLGQNPFEAFNLIKNNLSKTNTAIAGGIKLSASEEIKKANPDLLIIGGAISTADDPAEAAAEFKKILG